MIKYKKITDLSDGKIKKIINDIFNPLKINKIIKDVTRQEVVVLITREWLTENDDGADEVLELEDRIILTDPFIFEGIKNNSIHFDIFADDDDIYKRFCIANGVCEYLKENKYLKEK